MFEGIAKLVAVALGLAFSVGVWSATLEYRVRDQGNHAEKVDTRIDRIEDRYSSNQEKLVDVLGRIDERLKNLERR